MSFKDSVNKINSEIQFVCVHCAFRFDGGMARGCCVIHPSESGWCGEQMERAQTSSATRGEARSPSTSQ